MRVRQARATDWEALRTLRLRALADAPEAFASTLEQEAALPDEVWRRRAEGGPGLANFIADKDGVDVGLAAIFAEPNAPGCMQLVSMWVDPLYRRQGAARALVDRAVGWAADRQARGVILWVVERNTAARSFYERIGFQPTGERQPLSSNPARIERRLRLSLEGPRADARNPRARG